MGFRSTLTSSHYGNNFWPDWFKEKYGDLVSDRGVLRSNYEGKTYTEPWIDLPEDVQRALIETDRLGWAGNERPMDFTLAWLHECGGVTKLDIYPDRIYVADAVSWVRVPLDYGQDGIHDYCYGCSDLREAPELSTADTQS